jgi:hypothetical protein
MIQITIILLLICSNVLTISLINFIVNKKTKGRFALGEEPTSLYILKATLFICAGLMVTEIGTALKEVSQIYSIGEGLRNNWIGLFTYYAAFFSIAGLAIFVAIWLSMMLFAVLTKGKNIFGDALQGNLNYSILFAGTLFSIVFSMKPGLLEILIKLIQYPVLPGFH